MGFKYWVEALMVIGLFLVAIAVPCYFVASWGGKMINDIGNTPSQSAQIQASTGWKIIAVEIVSFVMLIGLFAFLYNLNSE